MPEPSSPPVAPPPWLRVAPGIFLLLWSGGFAFAKLGLPNTEPMTFLVLRYAMALALLLPLFVVLKPRLPARPAAWGHLVVVGFLIQVLYFGLSYLAFARGVSAGTVVLIVSLQPVLVAVLAPRFAGEHVPVLRWVGLLLGLTGAVLVVLVRSGVEPTDAAGLACALGALAGMTVATLYEKRFGSAQHPVSANLVQYTVGLLAILPLAWLTEDMRVDWNADLLIALAYLVIGNSLVSVSLLLAMVRHGEASRVSALFYLVPPGAALIAWLMLGETMPLLAWPGMALAALGVAIAARPARTS